MKAVKGARTVSLTVGCLCGAGVVNVGVGALLWVAGATLPDTEPKDRTFPDRTFPAVPISRIAASKWVRPRATIEGNVTYVTKEPDGDFHFKVSDGRAVVVCEIIPELPMTPPRVGMKVIVKGIVRYDRAHRWEELHPVVAWAEIHEERKALPNP